MWILALIGGAVLPLQALINARLGGVSGGPLWAAAISFGLGTLALLLYIGARRIGAPTLGEALQAPWWIWVGGALGAFYVASAIIAVPRLGAAALVAFVICGQVLAAMLLDHFGVLQAPKPINPTRLLGGALVIGGAWLVLHN